MFLMQVIIISENMQPPSVIGRKSHRPYFISFKRNLQQVFGKQFIFAVLPVASRLADFVMSTMIIPKNFFQ